MENKLPYLCVGYYADNLQKIAHVIHAADSGSAELAFFQAAYDECGYANGALVGVFEIPVEMMSKDDTELLDMHKDQSSGDQVNFGPSEFQDKCADKRKKRRKRN